MRQPRGATSASFARKTAAALSGGTFLLLHVLACGDIEPLSGTSQIPDPSDGGTHADVATTDASTDTPLPRIDASPDARPADFEPTAYAHSADRLFKVNLENERMDTGVALQGCGAVIDLAIDSNAQMVATTVSGLYRVDKASGACTQIAAAEKEPNSLTFAPTGVVSRSEEALVGFLSRDYVRIDPNTGTITPLLVNAIPPPYESSGDLVVRQSGHGFVTVTARRGHCALSDCVFEFDGATGEFIRDWGEIPYIEVWGLANWGPYLYGFTSDGAGFRMNFTSDAVVTQPLNLFDPAGFNGAASLSIAP